MSSSKPEAPQMQIDGASNGVPTEGVRVALLTAGPSGGPAGGAERHFQGLHDGLVAIGC
ncbi:MAG TPA: hypothetical protein VIC30_11305 [Orrella sp.]